MEVYLKHALQKDIWASDTTIRNVKNKTDNRILFSDKGSKIIHLSAMFSIYNQFLKLQHRQFDQLILLGIQQA
jgi:hypothetical protein